jgi:DNA repair protein RadC
LAASRRAYKDITTTAAILRAAETIAIPVVDHVIVMREADRYQSMLDRSTLPSID